MDLPVDEMECSSSGTLLVSGRNNGVKLNWLNKFDSESNVPCGLVSYENDSELEHATVLEAEAGEGCRERNNIVPLGMRPVPVAVRSVDVISVAVDYGLDVTVFQVYENRGNIKKELYYLLPVNDRMGLYRFEFRTYSLGIKTGPRSRDGEAFKVLTVTGIKDGLSTPVDHQSDHFNPRRSNYMKVYIGVIPPMDIIQVKLGFVQELSAVPNSIKNGDFVMQLQIPSIVFPNYGRVDRTNETLNSVEETCLSDKNQSYAVFEEYPVRFIFRVFQLFACDFECIPRIITFVIKETRGLKMAKKKDIWHPYQIDGKSTKSQMLNGLQISLSPTFEHKHEASLIAESYNEHTAAMLSCCINLESQDDSEVIFLLDQSGSMIGKSMSLAKTVLVEMLKKLPAEVQFNVVGFGSNYELFFKQSKVANREAIEQAISFVENSDATLGYTNLSYTLNSIMNSSSRRKSVVLISDGHVEDIHKVLDLLCQFRDQLRMFAVMTGGCSYDAVNSLKPFTDATNGILQYVLSDEDATRCSSSVIPHLAQPAFHRKIDWSSQDNLNVFSIAPDFVVSQWKVGLAYSGVQKALYALFPMSERDSRNVNVNSFTASITFEGIDCLEKLEVKSFESPASYISGTGATRLFHRLWALQFINEMKKHEAGQKDQNKDNSSTWTDEKIIQILEPLNLMTPYSTIIFLKNTKIVTDAWAQDTRYAPKASSRERYDNLTDPKPDANSSKSKRSSRAASSTPSIKELYGGDYSISCLRELMVGRNVFLNVGLQAADGSYDLSKEFCASLQIDFTYLNQARHRYVSKHSWATMVAFTILTNKLGVWKEDNEKISEAIEKSSEWLKIHMTEFEISACLHSALKVLWAYFQNEASLQTAETSRKRRQSYARFYQ